MGEIRSQYKASVAKLLGLAGLGDPAMRAERIVALETKIARSHVDNITSQDAHKANNPWAMADFAAKAPGIDWAAFWNAAGLGAQGSFIVWHPGAIAGAANLVASEPIEAWQDWLAFHRINTVTDVLPAAFDTAHFEFFSHTLNGTPKPRPRDKRAIASVNTWLGDAVGKLYVKDYFPASSKTDIEAMARNILAAFDKRVAALDWMAPATKEEARRKIATMRIGVGYPDAWRDYSALEVRANDPVGNLRRAELAETRHQLAKLGKPVDKGEWWMTPQTVNAVNLPLQNALNFPAAILQAPFYDPTADAAANYGAIGAVIGHEVTHSFDDLGATFDSSGRLRDWWTKEDFAHFKAAGAALVAQYNAYEALPGLFLNGQLTLSENIADVAGLTAAYEAYHASLGGREPPVIGGLTGDQRFFLSFAQSWRNKMREQLLRARVATDGHSPARWRVQTVRNLDAWYGAFEVQPGQALFLTPNKRVKVW
jgi:putative endopeptidase